MRQGSQKDQIFRANIDPAELESILRRIDENILLRSAGQQQASNFTLAQLPDLNAPKIQLQQLHEIDAPLFQIFGSPLVRFLKRLINLPLRLFGRKQLYYNRQLITALQAMLEFDDSVRQQSAAMSFMFAKLEANINMLEADNKRFITEQQEQYEQTAIVQRRLDLLALDLRKQTNTPRAERLALPEPRIVDLERYQQRIAAMEGKIRINLGCGEKPLPEYINIDVRTMPAVDIVADVRRLPFDTGTLMEINASHLIEHFREHQMRSHILPYWYSLLSPDGLLRIVCPNWEIMMIRLQNGAMAFADYKLLTFGSQDYEGDDHFAMYSPESLMALLHDAGFTRVEVVAEERMNSICPEMELVAYI